MIPALTSESVVARKLEPAGMTTRRGGPSEGLPQAISTASATIEMLRDSGLKLERMLKENGGGERVDVAPATPG